MNKKTMAVVLTSFVLSMGAGTLLGLNWARSTPHHGGHSWLTDELKLTPQQQEQMRAIWSQAMQKNDPNMGDRRHGLQKERDDAIAKLIPAEQKAAYDKILADYAAKVDAMGRERSKAFQDAVEHSRQILSDTQRQKYEDILKRGEHRHGLHGAPPDGPGHGPPPTTNK